jgi:uncharacterized membrane protein
MTRSRIASIDVLRGAVMLLMSLDHARVYSGLPAGGPSPGIFFTRWITHFCAPAFVFLAGTSAFFYGRKHDDLPRFLLTRGAWLIFLELTVLRLAWTFNLDTFLMAGVIWAIGWCMISLAALSLLPVGVVGTVGLVIITCHNLVDPHLRELIPVLVEGRFLGIWQILYLGFVGGPIALGNGFSLIVLYSLIPWIGVMATGFTFGKVLTLEPERRNRVCTILGLSAIGLFCLLRGCNLYGDPRPWAAASGPGTMPSLQAFLNTTKYPASLAFLLMTLGPTIAVIPLLERFPARLFRPITDLGRVPMFYYLLHIPLIHGLALLVSWIRLGEVSPWLFTNHPMGSPAPPEGTTWSLSLLYGVTVLANLMLYPACRWFGSLKKRRADAWLRYL